MTITIPLTYDGKVFRPEEPVSLPVDTHVKATIEIPQPPEAKPYLFFEVAASLNLDGPPDWSERLEEYLYGGLVSDD